MIKAKVLNYNSFSVASHTRYAQFKWEIRILKNWGEKNYILIVLDCTFLILIQNVDQYNVFLNYVFVPL